MKHRLLTLIAAAFVALSCISHGADTLDMAIRKLEPDTNKPAPTAFTRTSIFSYGLLDKFNRIQLAAWNGSLYVEGKTFNGKGTTLVFPDPTTNVTITFPTSAAASTVTLASKAVLTPASTVSFAPGAGVSTYTLVPAQAESINAVTTGAVAGKSYFLVITTSGTSAFVLTFGTNFKTTGTLSTGTTSAKVFVVQFIFDGTNFNEVSRTAAM